MKPYIEALEKINPDDIFKIAMILNSVAERGGRIFVAGNGGSSAVAQHFASDLMKPVGFEYLDKLSVINLSDNIAFMTAVGNDIGYHDIFSMAAEAHGMSEDDAVVAFSVSGSSKNVSRLIEMSYLHDTPTVAICGRPNNPSSAWPEKGWHYLAIDPDIDYGTPLYYCVCESAFSAVAHEIARQFHILRGNYAEAG